MFFAIILFSIALSLDSLGIGLSYGIKEIHIPIRSKLMISFLSTLLAFCALHFSGMVMGLVSDQIGKLIGCSILGALGIWMLLQGILKKSEKENMDPPIEEPGRHRIVLKLGLKCLNISIAVIKHPTSYDQDRSKSIDLKESFLLGIALSMDAVGASIGMGLTGASSLLIPFAIGAFQYLFLSIGLFTGKRFKQRTQKNLRIMDFLPGIIMLLLMCIRWLG